MAWPWIHRRRLAHSQKLLHVELAVSSELRGRNVELVAALQRSERERVDLQTKLLRVGFGINPFAELVPAQIESAQPPAADPDALPTLRPDMSDDEIRRTFTQEAVMRFGSGNMRKITSHVQARLDEFYQHRARPQMLTPEEQKRAFDVAADIQAAIDEGLAAARGNA